MPVIQLGESVNRQLESQNLEWLTISTKVPVIDKNKKPKTVKGKDGVEATVFEDVFRAEVRDRTSGVPVAKSQDADERAALQQALDKIPSNYQPQSVAAVASEIATAQSEAKDAQAEASRLAELLKQAGINPETGQKTKSS